MAVLVPADTQVQKSPSNYFRHLHQCRSHDLMCALMSAAVNQRRNEKKIKVQSQPCQIRASESRTVPAAAIEQLHGTLFQTFPDQFRSHSRAKQMKPKMLHSQRNKNHNFKLCICVRRLNAGVCSLCSQNAHRFPEPTASASRTADSTLGTQQTNDVCVCFFPSSTFL